MSRFEHWPYEACERIRELEATMGQVAGELREFSMDPEEPRVMESRLGALADRLDPRTP